MTVKHWNTGAAAARFKIQAASRKQQASSNRKVKMKINYLYGEDVVHAYPDGWSCISCGTDFDEETINVECLYVIQTKEGVECLKCVNEDD